MRLYHGSNVSIEKIDLTKCSPYKDFGQAYHTQRAIDNLKKI